MEISLALRVLLDTDTAITLSSLARTTGYSTNAAYVRDNDVNAAIRILKKEDAA